MDDNKIIITAAVTGSSPTKEMNPAVPYTPEEIVTAAVDCCRAGAAVTHIHVRDPKTGAPDFKIDLFREILEGIRERCDMIVNLTTSGLRLAGPDVISQRLQPVSLKPDMCSFDLGSMNFRDRVFLNPPEWGDAAAKSMQESGVKPEIEVFDVGHMYQAIHLIERGMIDDPPYFQLCMGAKWGIEGTVENLLFMKRKLPAHAVWSVLGVQKAQLPMITTGMLLGGHVRVGFEDNIYLKRGVLAESNARMVEMAVDLAERLGRTVATPKEARGILGIPALP
ncbi:MAG: 3-keto-5-aminohexanoate cleavage protein [Deltaproteobacteria bacterium]|nr:3-keto-5-aminohexanoate cleavage protein [Deltaproteobacteria bacterium]